MTSLHGPVTMEGAARTLACLAAVVPPAEWASVHFQNGSVVGVTLVREVHGDLQQRGAQRFSGNDFARNASRRGSRGRSPRARAAPGARGGPRAPVGVRDAPGEDAGAQPDGRAPVPTRPSARLCRYLSRSFRRTRSARMITSHVRSHGSRRRRAATLLASIFRRALVRPPRLPPSTGSAVPPSRPKYAMSCPECSAPVALRYLTHHYAMHHPGAPSGGALKCMLAAGFVPDGRRPLAWGPPLQPISQGQPPPRRKPGHTPPSTPERVSPSKLRRVRFSHEAMPAGPAVSEP